MRTSKALACPPLKCCKIVRPTSGSWLVVGPVVDSPTVVTIHRHQRRSVECLEPECPFCSALWSFEERVFLPVVLDVAGQRAVLELPTSHLERLKGWEMQYHSLRALMLHCRRANGQRNGPIEWRCFPRDGGMRTALTKWDWLGELSETWRRNTQFALQAVATEKTVRDVASGCMIDSLSDR